MFHPTGRAVNAEEAPEPLSTSEQLERRIAELDEQVRRLQSTASLGTMSLVLAHEVNNLLAPLQGYARYALQRDDPGLWRSALEKALAQAQKLCALADRLFQVTSEDDGAPSAALDEVVADVVGSLGRDLRKDNITLELEVVPGLRAATPAVVIRHVVLNLLINARQALLQRGGGNVTVTALRRCERIILCVTDNGPGIAPEVLERIFEPFFTTKGQQEARDRQGIGLGLTVCRRLLEEAGGTITAHSEPHRGATFEIDLPAATPYSR